MCAFIICPSGGGEARLGPARNGVIVTVRSEEYKPNKT